MEPNHPANTAAALPAGAVVAPMAPIDGGSSTFCGRKHFSASRGANVLPANRESTLLQRAVLQGRKAATRKPLRLLEPQEEAGGGGVGGSPGDVYYEKEISRARKNARRQRGLERSRVQAEGKNKSRRCQQGS